MSEPHPRLKAGVWVKMALRMGDRDGRPGVVLRGRDGLCVLSQTRTPDGTLAWMRATGAAPVDDVAVDAYVARQLRYDPDLWVLEFEAPGLLPPFEARIV